MNVLLLTDKLVTGGAEIYFCKLENYLQQTNLTLYTAACSGDLYEQLRNKEHFTMLRRRNHFYNIKSLVRKVKSCHIDIIHANSLRMVLYAAAIKKLLRSKLKIIYTKHNITMLEGKYSTIFSWIVNKNVDRVITVSEFERNNLLQMGVNLQLITTIHNGVDIEYFPFFRKEETCIKRVGILARLSDEKNHRLFLKIAYELVKFYPEQFEFFIGGDGPEAASIAQQIEELGLIKHVYCLGNIKYPEQFIREMDVLLLTSFREVFPMVILEAMATGTPVITINQGGIPEAIIDGETGFLISDYSDRLFVDKILHLRSDGKLYRYIAETARETVQSRFTLHHMVAQTLQEYLRCSAEKRCVQQRSTSVV
jgi:glycosyltransferase involved in cell wall biosynthesis